MERETFIQGSFKDRAKAIAKLQELVRESAGGRKAAVSPPNWVLAVASSPKTMKVMRTLTNY